MPQFPETELILSPENRVYHINLRNDDIADNVIVVGDQSRVPQISAFFDRIDFRTSHREFVTHTGEFNGKRITVLSTGIGTDNIDIVMNELDAAVNIDPVSRELNSKQRRLNIYRLGTSGALQEDIPVNSLVVSSHGIGLDGLLNFYSGHRDFCEEELSRAFIDHAGWLQELPFPYCAEADEGLISRFNTGFVKGITVTAPGFYGPQGRQLRLQSALPRLNDLLTSFEYKGMRISNFEMETSALYGLGKMLGHRCLTVCVIIANRVIKEFTTDYQASVNKLMKNCLEIIAEKK